MGLIPTINQGIGEEQGIGSREQGIGSREQGTGNGCE
jgi:hypothetical protein